VPDTKGQKMFAVKMAAASLNVTDPQHLFDQTLDDYSISESEKVTRLTSLLKNKATFIPDINLTMPMHYFERSTLAVSPPELRAKNRNLVKAAFAQISPDNKPFTVNLNYNKLEDVLGKEGISIIEEGVKTTQANEVSLQEVIKDRSGHDSQYAKDFQSAIIQSISNPAIKHLNLASNDFGSYPYNIKHIALAWQHRKKPLVSLNLADNGLYKSPEGVSMLGNTVRDLPALKHPLELGNIEHESDNDFHGLINFSDNGLGKVSEALEKFMQGVSETHHGYFNFSFNELGTTGKGTLATGKALQNPHLRFVRLQINDLGTAPETKKEFIESIASAQIEELNIWGNNLMTNDADKDSMGTALGKTKIKKIIVDIPREAGLMTKATIRRNHVFLEEELGQLKTYKYMERHHTPDTLLPQNRDNILDGYDKSYYDTFFFTKPGQRNDGAYEYLRPIHSPYLTPYLKQKEKQIAARIIEQFIFKINTGDSGTETAPGVAKVRETDKTALKNAFSENVKALFDSATLAHMRHAASMPYPGGTLEEKFLKRMQQAALPEGTPMTGT
jgi:hypothetical protein